MSKALLEAQTRVREPRERDALFRSTDIGAADFNFGAATARVFDDMLNRSVPLYQEIQRMTVELACRFAQRETRVYDLGCSTGTTLLHLTRACGDLGLEFIGVDNSEAMLERAREKLAGVRCVLTLADIDSLQPENASVILLLLTLQFIRPVRRAALIRRLATGLVNGGALIVVEKTVSSDSVLNRVFIEHYHQFKMRQGYSMLEVARKREALENVLVPFRLGENLELLHDNGFEVAEIFFRWYNFAGIVALRRAAMGGAT